LHGGGQPAEIKEGVHAVALTTLTPEEDKEKEVV
jgi:acid stress-induced BolA-like protein IbaG/YrbA